MGIAGHYDPYVVYGVMEGSRCDVVDYDWMEDNFPKLTVYTNKVHFKCMVHAVYGFAVSLDSATGQVKEATEKQKECVQKFYTLLTDYWKAKKKKSKDIRMPKVGYFLAVDCDDYSPEDEHEWYIPVLEENANENEEEKNEERQEEEENENEEENEEEVEEDEDENEKEEKEENENEEEEKEEDKKKENEKDENEDEERLSKKSRYGC